MIGLPTHLREDRLFDCYLSIRAGEPLDPRAAEHLAECAACSERFDTLRQFMDSLRDEADAEIDEVFPAELLRQQQQRIARRLATAGRPARVIHFPAPQPAAPAATPRRPVLPRWAAGAAAAGLFLGVAAGLFFRGAPVRDGIRPVPAPLQATRLAPIGTLAGTAEEAPPATGADASGAAFTDRDDLFLTELEVAAGGPRTAELAAFDALTPHIREVSFSVSR